MTASSENLLQRSGREHRAEDKGEDDGEDQDDGEGEYETEYLTAIRAGRHHASVISNLQ